jgi:hypothetical protein
MSLNQYPTMVILVQVLLSGTTTSRSIFVQVPSGAKEEVSFGKIQPSTWRFSFRDSLARDTLSRIIDAIVTFSNYLDGPEEEMEFHSG